MSKFVILLTLFALAGFASGAEYKTVHSMQQVQVKTLYDSIVTKDYNPNVRPVGVNGSYTTYVYTSLKDLNVLSVDPLQGVFTIQGYARKEWVDPRLAYNDTSIPFLPVRDCKSLWTPDLYFLQGLEVGSYPSNFHHPAKTFRIYPNGRVFFSFFLTQSIRCPALFKASKEQVTCPVRLESYGHFEDELRLMFGDQGGEGVSTVKEVVLPNFTFGGVTPFVTCDKEEVAKVRTSEVGGRSHSCIQADFKFTKQ